MKPLIYILAIFTLPVQAIAQSTILVTNSSAKYNAKITGVKCVGNVCGGVGKVQLLEKERNRGVQSFTSDDLIVRLDSSRQPREKQASPAEGEYPLIFDDFNFDDEEDVAIRNGSNSSYGGPSYDVYLYDPERKTFVADKQFTKLASENLGMFETDRRRKQLTVYQKDGCCRHITITYGIKNGKSLVKTGEVIEEGGGEMVTVTTSQLVNGRMKKSVKRYKAGEYQRGQEE